MNSLQIKYFIGTVECHSISRSAESFFISQPALSKHIKNLEQELGVVLLKRSSSGVALTEAGKLLYNYFSAAGQEFQLILEEARRLNRSLATTLRLGVPADWDISQFILDVKANFFQLHPQTVINTGSQNDLITLIARLRDHFYDLLFLPFMPSSYLDGITTLPLTEVPMALMASCQHPIWQSNPVSAQSFQHELFLVTGHDGFDIAKRSMCKHLEPYKFTPRIETRSSLGAVMLGVLNNEGVTLRDMWSLSITNPGLRHMVLPSTQSVYLAYRTSADSAPLMDFIHLLTAHFSSPAQT